MGTFLSCILPGHKFQQYCQRIHVREEQNEVLTPLNPINIYQNIYEEQSPTTNTTPILPQFWD